jgi:hypothetical protein
MRYLIVMRRAVLCLACLLLPLNVTAQPVSSVVPPEVYRAAGLDKLTEAERKALIDWINAGARTAEPAAPSAAPAIPAALDSADQQTPMVATTPISLPSAARVVEDDEINTRILPPFTGWSGRTVFTMENGQVWQQRMDGSYTFKGGDARVVITRGAFGLDRMRHVESGRWIGVKRIK